MYFVVRTRQHMYVAHDARHYTQPSATDAHAYIHAGQTRLARTPTFIPVYNGILHKRAPLLHTHASRLCLHSLECLECGVVGKCCRNVLHSLLTYGVSPKAVRIRTCDNCTAHVRCSRCAIPYTQPSAISYTPHAYMHIDCKKYRSST
jgi:hypothetical protein